MAARWSSLWDGCRQPPRAAYPQLERPGPGLAAYLALLRPGVAVPRPLPDARWALTPPFHPYPLDTRAVCFLWPCSVASRRPGVTWRSARRSPAPRNDGAPAAGRARRGATAIPAHRGSRSRAAGRRRTSRWEASWRETQSGGPGERAAARRVARARARRLRLRAPRNT